MQSLLFFGGFTVLTIVILNIFKYEYYFRFLSGFAFVLFMVMCLVAGVGWLVGLVSAVSGKRTKLPFVGDFAERFVGSDAFPK